MPAMTSAAWNAISRSCTAAWLLAALAGCGSAPPVQPPVPPPAPAPDVPPVPRAASAPRPGWTRYRCDHDVSFTVEYGDDSATLEVAQHGREVLLRDAGGVTPQQTVYSSERMRAEFGLGADGEDAVLRYADPPLVLHCARG
jgi:hypothetical protein